MISSCLLLFFAATGVLLIIVTTRREMLRKHSIASYFSVIAEPFALLGAANLLVRLVDTETNLVEFFSVAGEGDIGHDKVAVWHLRDALSALGFAMSPATNAATRAAVVPLRVVAALARLNTL